jgi:hypothetical protein
LPAEDDAEAEGDGAAACGFDAAEDGEALAAARPAGDVAAAALVVDGLAD